MDSRYFTGSASILTYKLEELLGTKVRALYQRKKGRDLFDLWMAFSSTDVQPEKVLNCFLHYMEHEGHKVSRAEFEQNFVQKLDDSRFLKDIEPLLTTDRNWNSSKAGEFLMNRLLALLPGEPWQGGKS